MFRKLVKYTAKSCHLLCFRKQNYYLNSVPTFDQDTVTVNILCIFKKNKVPYFEMTFVLARRSQV